MSADLAGRTAWITGAGSGIGRAIAQGFAAAGMRLALTGRRRDALEETAAKVGGAHVAPCDVTDPAQVEAAHASVVAALGDPDILVNCAGFNVPKRHWRELEPAGAIQVLDANLRGPVLCSLAVLPAMRARGRGLLIHIASLAGKGMFLVSGPTYSAAKHGAVAMSASINAEEGINGIRSVCISPGEVDTPILASRPRPPGPEERALMLQPEDIAEAALFAARMHPRACPMEIVLVPTDNNAFRSQAHAIAGRG